MCAPKEPVRVSLPRPNPDSAAGVVGACAEIPGVTWIEAKAGQMIVHFADGRHATVERCPLAGWSGKERFNVWLDPASRKPKDPLNRMAPSLTPEEVVALLKKIAAEVR